MRIDANLNDHEFAIHLVSNYRIHGITHKDFLLWIKFNKYEFQISRTLLRPINRAEVIVKAVSKKPK